MMLVTTTPAQTAAVNRADEKIAVLGSAARAHARPLFKVIIELDHRLEAALRKIAELESELDARKDNP